MAGRDLIVVGASAGGVEALCGLVRRLPSDLPAAVLIVLHVSPDSRSALPTILGRAGPLPAHHALDGEPIKPGQIYVAPPDYHLLIREDRTILWHGPNENSHRPAVDPLFRSAARARGRRVVGIILSGARDDGTLGLLAIKARGGVAVVQSPDDALFPGMPASAVEHADVDYCLPLSEIGPVVERLVREPLDDEGAQTMNEEMKTEAELVEPPLAATEGVSLGGSPSVFSCPECHGTLWEVRDHELSHFRCRIGHAYSMQSLMAAHSESLEAALWAAVRSLDERVALLQRMAGRARERGRRRMEQNLGEQAESAAQQAKIIRNVLLGATTSAPNEGDAVPAARAYETAEEAG